MASPPRHLLYENVAAGRPYHAALIATDGASARGFQVTEHSHDFCELMYVLAGEATHVVNGEAAPMYAGDLVFLRAGKDRHAVRFRPGRPLHYVNIALPASSWAAFRDLARLDDLGSLLTTALTAKGAVEAAGAFRSALGAFPGTGGDAAGAGLELCSLLATTCRLLRAPALAEPEADEEMPPWLSRACGVLRRDADALRAGLPRFVEEAGVTRTHLARVLKATTGQTPTEYVNDLRLASAARLLDTTTLSILDVAGECGFEQASYFYRLFRARYGVPPHAYRVSARRSVAPGAR